MAFYLKDNPVQEFPRLTHFGYCSEETIRSVPSHVHLGYEIVYFETGQGEVIIRDGDNPVELEADDVLITRPRIRHRFVVKGREVAYTWFGLQTDALVQQTPEHKMASLPLIPPSSFGFDWLGEPLFRETFVQLGRKMGSAEYKVLHRIPEVARAFNTLKEEVTGHRLHRANLVYASLVEIFTRLSRRLEIGVAASRDPILFQLVEYINAHYSENLNLERLSDHVGYTQAYLSRIFSRKTGQTVTRFIEHVRMKNARELLAAGIPVGRASKLSGFSRPSYFSRRFVSLFGVTPREWQKLESSS